MTETIGVIAALLSAISQATAHALLAAGRDKLVIRGLIGLTELVVAAPLTLLTPLPSGALWFWLLASGVLHAIYQLTLIKAYEGEDFSVAYPMARGIVPLATAILGVSILASVGWARPMCPRVAESDEFSRVGKTKNVLPIK